jgi:hypothetical protein
MAVGVFVRIELCIAALQREHVFHAVALPRRLGCVALIKHCVKPDEPTREHNLRRIGVSSIERE